MTQLHLSLPESVMTFNNAKSKLVVLSGGEPFEYEHIKGLLQYLEITKQFFRIATGGHVDLEPFIESLKRSESLAGISVGTDVISHRSLESTSLERKWQKNINFLNESNLPYSLTFTVLEDLDGAVNLVAKTLALGAQPEFIYLRISSLTPLNTVKKEILSYYPNIQLITDEI